MRRRAEGPKGTPKDTQAVPTQAPLLSVAGSVSTAT